MNGLVCGLGLYHGTYWPPTLGHDGDMKIPHLAVTVASVGAGDDNCICLVITYQQRSCADVELVFTSIVIVTITTATIPTHCSVRWVGVGIDGNIKCVVPVYGNLEE